MKPDTIRKVMDEMLPMLEGKLVSYEARDFTRYGIVIPVEQILIYIQNLGTTTSMNITGKVWAIWKNNPAAAVSEFELAVEKNLIPVALGGRLTFTELDKDFTIIDQPEGENF